MKTEQKYAQIRSLISLRPLEEMISADGQTRKVLLELEDGKTIESALMVYSKPGSSRIRKTICVSSQVGCSIGCVFCATGKQGFERNLRPDEIIEQILYFQEVMPSGKSGESPLMPEFKVTNVVFMGMGEPLANYDNVKQAIGILNSPKGLGLGRRQITLSTVGLTPLIRQLAEDNLQMELAVSLHSAMDEVRNRLVPLNQKYPLEELIRTCREYSIKKKCRIFYEYALFSGVNDAEGDARALVSLIREHDCSVNLIIANPISGSVFHPTTIERALAFQKRVIHGGIRCMIRISKGTDIQAGCGQLKSRYLS